MSAETNSSRSWFTRPKIIGTVATVVSCIIGLAAYLKPWDQSGTTQANTIQGTLHGNATQSNLTQSGGTNVTASGNNSTAVGGDMHVGRREVRDQYDATPEREAAVKNYLQVAQESCGKQVSMITDMNKDTVVELNSMTTLSRLEMYPSELVAEHLGDDVYNGIKSRVEAAQQAMGGAIGLLMSNAVFKQSGMQREAKPEQVAAFESGRGAWLKATSDLCGYFNEVRRKHSL